MKDETGQMDAVRRAQLQSALSNLAVSLSANIFIAGSAALIVYQDMHDWLVFLWLSLVIALNMVRMTYGLMQKRKLPAIAKPELVLRNLAILAFFGGLAWVPFPTYFIASIETRTAAYVVFIMAGITTGAIIQSLAYWRISVAFGAPILTATIVELLLQGHAIDYVVAGNLFLLMAMLFRIAIISEGTFRQNHLTTLKATELANSLQLANEEVQNANETLKRLATTDPLTGLANRSVFNKVLANLIHAREPVALALIDIDHFKQINDGYGHAVGDEILCSVALFLMDNASEGITPTRLGGDEFAIIASGAGCSERLLRYTRKVKGNIEGIRIHAVPTEVTFSVGICADERATKSASELFAEADTALYAAKAAGRNRIHDTGRSPQARAGS
jgi:diguanylate cyclase (GGDEF)-like protein